MTSPKQNTLRELFKNQFEQDKLNESELETLLALQSIKKTENKTSDNRSRFAMVFASACLAAMIGLFFLHGKPDYIDAIADEVVYNHLKLKPLEVESGNFLETQRYFTKLDFVPTETKQTDLSTTLIGGRYCSIGGSSAAQLRFSETNGNIATLYQVSYDPEKYGDIPILNKGDLPLEVLHSGLKVTLWVENGLLMVNVSEI